MCLGLTGVINKKVFSDAIRRAFNEQSDPKESLCKGGSKQWICLINKFIFLKDPNGLQSISPGYLFTIVVCLG